MLRLLLLRHAQSDWNRSGVPDHDRPLNPRGLRDAPEVGRWLREQDLVPSRALVSSARRTTETARLALRAAGVRASDQPEADLPPAARRFRRLYGAPAAGIVETVRREGGSASPLLVVGHNPGMMELAARFRGRWETFPTAALLVAGVRAGRWLDLNPTTAVTVEHFLRPRVR